MFSRALLLSFLSLPVAKSTDPASYYDLSGGRHYKGQLQATDCQLRCPQSVLPDQVILPAITDARRETGEWENVLECWSVDTTTTNMAGIDNAYRLDWKEGFDATYQYIFTGPSYMGPHTIPEPSLAIMSAGVGDVRVASGRCLRLKAGDIFFNVGTKGLQTAWFSEGSVVSDLYFKGRQIPDHKVIPELVERTEDGSGRKDEL
ncbi:hypothetical protein F4808DRAFT_338350 [Astrocystis sublimbata]|nr:hypothetical protein F4808DRAFT_338350 [Astrocystis sublimbata]